MESKEQTQITMKGKRTKRQRPQSPFPFSLASNSLNEDDGSRFESTYNVKMEPSPTSSYGYADSCTEEEEDMANCLILLAQGQSIIRESRKELADNNHDNMDNRKSSKRFLETASNGDGKVGYYVYECKTCNRTFPSFQALGGHRASHKKPKTNYVEDIRKTNNNIVEQDTGDEQCRNNNSPFPLQLSYSDRGTYRNVRHNTTRNHNNKGSNKVHECSICGAEFNSGQALGGHMRRHRGAIAATNTILSLSPIVTESNNQDQSNKTRKVLSLDLDLNLPAPEGDNLELGSHLALKQEHQHHQQQQHQNQQQQQQQSLVFSSPALVDCQY